MGASFEMSEVIEGLPSQNAVLHCSIREVRFISVVSRDGSDSGAISLSEFASLLHDPKANIGVQLGATLRNEIYSRSYAKLRPIVGTDVAFHSIWEPEICSTYP